MKKINYIKQIEDEIKVEENNISKLTKIYKSYPEGIRELERFYILRNKFVLESKMENLLNVKLYQELLKRYSNNVNEQGAIYLEEYIIFNPDINIRINDTLENDGFDLTEEGTKYLARLIENLYHERKLYYEHENKFDYFNLDDYSNIHYEMLGVSKEQAIYQIISSISTNKFEKGYSISEIVYEFVDNLGYYNIDRDNKKRKKYSK